jgi:hypothetical protein
MAFSCSGCILSKRGLWKKVDVPKSCKCEGCVKGKGVCKGRKGCKGEWCVGEVEESRKAIAKAREYAVSSESGETEVGFKGQQKGLYEIKWERWAI